MLLYLLFDVDGWEKPKQPENLITFLFLLLNETSNLHRVPVILVPVGVIATNNKVMQAMHSARDVSLFLLYGVQQQQPK